MKYPLYNFLTYILLCIGFIQAQNSDSLTTDNLDNVEKSEVATLQKVYLFEIHDEIGPGATRVTENAIKSAYENNADYLVLDLNTFGGLVEDADKIRTAMLECKIPTIVFIRNNAASAGALISIACDSIYMNTGSTIGAAAVVKQDGSYAEEKYQSYMRTKMRATAEATNRNPDIAEGMVNPKVYIEGVTENDEIITFTVDEAIANNFCNGKAESIEEVLAIANLNNAEIIKHEVSGTEKIIQLLVKPYVAGILLMILIGGIYFELQTPGVGFPLAASIIAAILYFAPHYLEGMAAHWEIALFIIGIILLAVEVFIIPGFGIAGLSGIAAVIISLSLALIKNINGFDFSFVPANEIGSAFLMVTGIMVVGILVLLFASKNLASAKAFQRLSLSTELSKAQGVEISASSTKSYEGREGVVTADLRPSGKIEIDEIQFDAQSDGEYLLKGTKVLVRKQQSAYLIVTEIRS